MTLRSHRFLPAASWYPVPQALARNKTGENSKNETPVDVPTSPLVASSSGSSSCCPDPVPNWSSSSSTPARGTGGKRTIAPTDSTAAHACRMYAPVVDGAEIEMNSRVPGTDDDSSAPGTDGNNSVDYIINGDDSSVWS